MNIQLIPGMRMCSIALSLILILGSCSNSDNKKTENSAQDTSAADPYVDAVADREVEAANTANKQETLLSAANDTSTENSATKPSGTSMATTKPETNKTAKAPQTAETEPAKEKATPGQSQSAPVIPPKTVDEKPETNISTQPQTVPKEEPATESPKEVNTPQAAKQDAKPAPDNWIVPEKDKNKSNPIKADAESLSIGKSLYVKHCASCHGKKGRGDGSKAAQLDTSCGDFTLAAFQKQTDGALFYKIKTGKDDMPGFKKKFPYEEDIWSIVNYIRTLK